MEWVDACVCVVVGHTCCNHAGTDCTATLPALPHCLTASPLPRWYRASGKLTKQLVGPPASVVLETRKLLEEFMERIPLITALCNPGMQPRHWKEISRLVGESLG